MINGRFGSMRVDEPDGANKIQGAEARGEALHQVPSTMQGLQQTTGQILISTAQWGFLEICLLAYNRAVALK